MAQTVDLYIKNKNKLNEWQNFLQTLDIVNFSADEVSQIDETIGIYEHDQLVATGSLAGNVLKYIGVCNQNSVQGAYFNQIVSELVNRAAQRDVFHLFVFTKPQYIKSFEHIGFSLLASSPYAGILETGDWSVDRYLEKIPKFSSSDKIAAIVMNANPFTNGHRYLVERASQKNDHVYVFVVNHDVSLFTTQERIKLVKEGTKDLKNITVLSGDDYMVSFATFPAYFLKDNVDQIHYQTQLDAEIFKEKIAPALHIGTRFLGNEPNSHTTSIYNQMLQETLSPEVAVEIIERKKDTKDNVISARNVREAIKIGYIEKIKEWVPITTNEFINTHLKELQTRIKKGMKINGN